MNDYHVADLASRVEWANAVVFLGGTVGTNNWREALIKNVTARGVRPNQLFNPVVDDWNEEAQRREDEVKATARYVVFYIALPGTEGNEVSVYSLVELLLALMDDQGQPGARTVAAFNTDGMNPHLTKVVNKSVRDLRARFPQAIILDSLDALNNWLVQRLT